MIKAFFLLKRKSGITHKEFRNHYEGSHAKLGQKYLSDFLISYERNYIGEVRSSRSQGRISLPWNYDCLTEWVLESEESLERLYNAFAEPEIGNEFFVDEERFLDREAVIAIICREGDTVNTGTQLSEI